MADGIIDENHQQRPEEQDSGDVYKVTVTVNKATGKVSATGELSGTDILVKCKVTSTSFNNYSSYTIGSVTIAKTNSSFGKQIGKASTHDDAEADSAVIGTHVAGDSKNFDIVVPGSWKPFASEEGLNYYTVKINLKPVTTHWNTGLDEADPNYDSFGNNKWKMEAKGYTVDSDCITHYGKLYDYNGTHPGLGNGMVNGTYDGTYTKKEAEETILQAFSGSNAALTSSWRKSYGAGVKSLTDADGYTKYFVYVSTNEYGDTYSESQITAYLNNLASLATALNTNYTGRSIFEMDAELDTNVCASFQIGKHLLVSYYYDQYEAEYYCQLLNALGAIYLGSASSGTVSVPNPHDVWVDRNSSRNDSGRFSLSIRSYHEHPETGQMMCIPSVAKRGLADTFFSEYIHFMLNRKKLSIKKMCNVQYLTDMRWKEKYHISGHTGWIDKVSTKISNNKGIEEVEFTMFEL